MSEILAIILCISLISAIILFPIESFADNTTPTQYDNVFKFKNVGDWFEVSVDVTGKKFMQAFIDEVDHEVPISGIYTLEIWTPQGGRNSYVYPEYGSSGQYLSIDVNIMVGSVFTTYGLPSDGVGLKRVVQLCGGNGADGRPGSAESPGDGYFGGNGGDSSYPNSIYGVCTKGGDGYHGGKGGYTADYRQTGPGAGGDGFIPGAPGGSGGAYGNTLTFPIGSNPINQNAEGTIKYRTWGRFPSEITTTENKTNIAKIKITLKEIVPDMKLEDSQISADLDLNMLYSGLSARFSSLESKLGSSSDTIDFPLDTIVVVKDKPFDILLPEQFDYLDSDTVGTLTLTNDDKSDGIISLSGTLSSSGYVTTLISGKRFVFNVVVEPTSETVTSLL